MEVKNFGPTIKDMNLSRNLQEKVDTFEPYMIREVLLLSPGVWNGLYFSAETIIEGYTSTDWTNRKNFELIYEHDTDAQNWVGYVINRRVTPNGEVFGDLEIYDEQLAINLGKGNAKMGISASMTGNTDNVNYYVGGFKNFSVVSEPACKPALINLSAGNKLEFLKSKDISLTTIYSEEERTEPVYLTSTDAGHHHEYTKLDEITSMVNGHAHKLNLNAMIAEEMDGHSHKLLSTEKNNVPVEENIDPETPGKDKEGTVSDDNMHLNFIEEIKEDDKKSKMEKMEKVLSESEKLSSSLDMILSKLNELTTKVANLEEAKLETPIKEEEEEEVVVVVEETPVVEEEVVEEVVVEEAVAELSQEAPKEEETPVVPTPAPAAPVDNSAEELAKVKAELAALKAETATPKKLEAAPTPQPTRAVAMDRRSDVDKLIEARLSRILNK